MRVPVKLRLRGSATKTLWLLTGASALGFTAGRLVTIDPTAAGWGWGAGGLDLLTVVSHELGHVLLEHDEGLMADTLAPGQVEVPAWITASKPGRIGAHKRVTVGKHLRAPHARPGALRLPR